MDKLISIFDFICRPAAKANPFREVPKDGPLGMLSMILTMVVIGVASFAAGGFGQLETGLLRFVSGDGQLIHQEYRSLGEILPEMGAIIVVALLLAIGASKLVEAFVGPPHERGKLVDAPEEEANLFAPIFSVVFFEEIYARVIWAWGIPMLLAPKSVVFFYLCVLIGNSSWAAAHIYNYKDERDHQILRVLPQFISGAFFAYFFTKYDLTAALFAHFAYDAVLFTSHKIQRLNWVDIAITVYQLVVAAVCFHMMEKPVASAAQWLSVSASPAIAGWHLRDYLLLGLFLQGVWNGAISALLFDRSDIGATAARRFSSHPLMVLVGAPLIIGIAAAAFTIGGFFIHSIPLRVLAVAVLLCYLEKDKSGSELAGTFFLNVPLMFILLNVVEAMPFWPVVGYLLVSWAVWMPVVYLKTLDD